MNCNAIFSVDVQCCKHTLCGDVGSVDMALMQPSGHIMGCQARLQQGLLHAWPLPVAVAVLTAGIAVE